MQLELIRQSGEEIDAVRGALAEIITVKHFQVKPELETRYGAAGREKWRQDAALHLSYLCEALLHAQPALFADYVLWAKTLLENRGVPEKDLIENLHILRQSLNEVISKQNRQIACDYVNAGIEQLAKKEPPAAPVKEFTLKKLSDKYLAALLAGRRDTASRLILSAVEAGTTVREIYLRVFQPAQHEIGRLWQQNKISVAQEHYCTAATQMIMSQLYPHIFSAQRNGKTLVATCVSGDLHEIGVRMVCDFFEIEGWDTFYLGANTPTEDVLRTLKERAADLVLISATMTFHLRFVREQIAAIRGDAATRAIKIMVGGYPFNVAPDLWKEIGADGYASDAARAIETAENLISGARKR